MGPVEPTTSVASPPDPAQDHPATTLPYNISVILHAVGVLLTYGRHLIDTVCQRANAPHFGAIASCFGTANVTTILAHLNRGILRAAALERVLLARAAAGQDLDFVERPAPKPQQPPAATDAQSAAAAAPAAEPPPGRKSAPRPSRPTGWNDPTFFMPTPEDLERQARRRPVGRTILDICLDLAVVPGICNSAFWGELYDLITLFGSNVAPLMKEKSRRWWAYDKEQDRNPNVTWDWASMNRDALRQVIGFFIGEPPVNPLDPAAGIATAPP